MEQREAEERLKKGVENSREKRTRLLCKYVHLIGGYTLILAQTDLHVCSGVKMKRYNQCHAVLSCLTLNLRYCH